MSKIEDDKTKVTENRQKVDPPQQLTDKFKTGKSFQRCPTCNRFHRGQCRLETIDCFKCGKKGHYARDCTELTIVETPVEKAPGMEKGKATVDRGKTPTDRGKKQVAQGRVFSLDQETTEATGSVVKGNF